MSNKPSDFDVLAALRQNLSRQDVANKLGVSKSYISRVIARTGFKVDKKAIRNSPAYKARRQNQSEAQKLAQTKAWSDQALREKQSEVMSAITSTVEYRQKQSGIQSRIWEDPTLRANISAKISAAWADQGVRTKYVSAINTRWSDPAEREKQSARSKAKWADPEYRATTTAALLSEDTRTKIAASNARMPVTNSKPHLKVQRLLKSMCIEFKVEHQFGPWNVDIYIPNWKIVIEVHGNYWHGLEKQEVRDKAKSAYISKYFPDHQIYYIWEHECLQEGKVAAKLRRWLGIDKELLVEYAFTDLAIETATDNKTTDQFLYDWHYQHHGRHGTDIVAKHNGDIVAIARFISPTRQEIPEASGFKSDEVFELSRFCIRPDYQKKNMATWFLSRARKAVSRDGIKCLISFADATYNHVGTIYKADNWVLERIVKPGYWYVDSDGWVNHKKTLWNHAKKMGLSEADYAAKYGFTKVCGKEKYKYTHTIKSPRQ
jgi:very-short-patch-repair endonuclease/GNAT superfamily N-acetyltransferase